MIGKIFITRSGYDPQLGKHVKDPYLGSSPTLGACRPDFRRQVEPGDHIFVISGKIPDIQQFVMVGFEVAAKIDARRAYELFPEHRLRSRQDGQLTGNIIVDGDGGQHYLDDHNSFDSRIKNYVLGTNAVIPATSEEIETARKETLEVLRDVLHKNGKSPVAVVGRGGTRLDETQVSQLRNWLLALKASSN